MAASVRPSAGQAVQQASRRAGTSVKAVGGHPGCWGRRRRPSWPEQAARSGAPELDWLLGESSHPSAEPQAPELPRCCTYCWRAGSRTTDGDGIHGLDGTWKDGLASGNDLEIYQTTDWQAPPPQRAHRGSRSGVAAWDKRRPGGAQRSRVARRLCMCIHSKGAIHDGHRKDTWGTARLAGQGQLLGASHVLGRRAVSTAGGPNGTHGSPVPNH